MPLIWNSAPANLREAGVVEGSAERRIVQIVFAPSRIKTATPGKILLLHHLAQGTIKYYGVKFCL
jgi:hypothetical protein